MSDTPRTDALRAAIDNGKAVEAEMTCLAQTLERERDEARDVSFTLKLKCKMMQDALDDLDKLSK
jgi:hypothetical protein